jgi:hypothetical protein
MQKNLYIAKKVSERKIKRFQIVDELDEIVSVMKEEKEQQLKSNNNNKK